MIKTNCLNPNLIEVQFGDGSTYVEVGATTTPQNMSHVTLSSMIQAVPMGYLESINNENVDTRAPQIMLMFKNTKGIDLLITQLQAARSKLNQEG